MSLIPREKDIDLLSPESQLSYYSGDFSKLPPVVHATDYFIKENHLKTEGMRVIVLGHGFLVGKPVAHYLRHVGAQVEVIEDYKRQKPLSCQLLVLSAGLPNLVDGGDISKGTHVIDFGSSVVGGRTVGDLDMNTKLDHLGVISPSPRGMGPLVVRFLVGNFLGV